MINTTPSNFFDALSNGRASSFPFVDVFATRNPTTLDINYPTQKKWWNTDANTYWILSGFSSMGGYVTAIWKEITGGGTGLTKVTVDTFTFPGTNPVIPDGSGNINITGGQIEAGTTANVIQTNSLAPNTFTIEIQRTTTSVSTNAAKNGVAHFNSADFTVDANGFVSIVGGPSQTGVMVDTATDPGVNPVLPNGSGIITVTGGQIAAGSTANVIRTDSLALNTYTIEIQRSQAVGSSTVGDNGVCHFSSAEFSVDGNGFVTLLNGAPLVALDVDAHTPPGEDPVEPNAQGIIQITGGQVVAGTTANVIQSNSVALNQVTIEIQRSQAVASSTVGVNGVSHFNNTEFSVDANGFVSLIGGPAETGVTVDTATGPGVNPVLPNSSGLITVTGGQIAAGSTANVIRTDSLALHTYTIEIQRSTTAASSTIADNGVCHFSSAQFTVDANGFVQILGGQAVVGFTVDADSGAGTQPVVPNPVTGLVTITGGQVAAGTTVHAIRTDSLAANTYTIEIQRSQAVASSTVGDNGISHFDSTSFAVDANGFVTLNGGGFKWNDVSGAFSPLKNNGYFVTATATGTLPAVPVQGDTVKFFVDSSSQFLTIQAAGTQLIRLGSLVSSAGGTAVSTLQGDSVELVYRAADTCWCAVGGFSGTWIMA